MGRGKKKVKAGRVPSMFREQPVKPKATRPLPKNRSTSFVESELESDQVLSSLSPSLGKEPSESCRRSAWNWKIDWRNQATSNKKWMPSEIEQYVAWRK